MLGDPSPRSSLVNEKKESQDSAYNDHPFAPTPSTYFTYSIPPTPDPRQGTPVTMSACGPGQLKEPARRFGWLRPHPHPELKGKICRFLISKKVIGAFVLMTLWALICDDLRLLTNKSLDDFFNAIVLVCILTFLTEIALTSYAKDDYFLGFIFWLDLIATLSLLMDLTWLFQEVLDNRSWNSGDDSVMDRARSSRSAKAGASVGRMVRALRLIRLLKLHSAYFSRGHSAYPLLADQDRMSGIALYGASEPGVSTEDFDEDGDAKDTSRESIVGKKLSSLTVMRLICVVIATMFGITLMTVDPASQTPTSIEWGADSVFLAYQRWQSGSHTQWYYEKSLLNYVFFHNWFQGHAGTCGDGKKCPSDVLEHLFWMGMVVPALSDSRDIDALLETARVRPDSLSEWFATVPDPAFEYQMGGVPLQAERLLTSPWNTSCQLGDTLMYGVSLLSERIDDYVSYTVECPTDLRYGDADFYRPAWLSSDQYDDWYFIFFFDRRPFTHMTAIYSLLTTAFICAVLMLGSISFTRDANILVLQPVEQMMGKVVQIAENPFVAKGLADATFHAQAVKEVRQRTLKAMYERRGWHWMWRVHRALRKQQQEEHLETGILDRTIIKLGCLVACGTGEVGCGILSNSVNEFGSIVDAKSCRRDCIVGLARIHEFMHLTEVLQAKIMTFVNQVAEVVHGLVDEYHGLCNKNDGDSFFLIWRVSDWKDTEISVLADMSLASLARMLGGIHRSYKIAAYRSHPGLQDRLCNSRCGGLTFGLHFGWAIECAIGTEFKIDVAYISPTVTTTQSVERATKLYGASCLVTNKVVEICSGEMVSHCRLIDNVSIPCVKETLKLYSLDLDHRAVEQKLQGVKLPWSFRNRYKARQILEVNKMQWRTGTVSPCTVFETVYEVQAMRRPYTVEFLQLFIMGYQNYAQGEWRAARQMLKNTKNMLDREDGPSAALLDYMAQFEFHAPEDWVGVRSLYIE